MNPLLDKPCPKWCTATNPHHHASTAKTEVRRVLTA